MPGNLVPPDSFRKFKKEDIEQSIPARFEQMVVKYPDQLAIKTQDHELTYLELNQKANRIAHTILAQHGEGEEPVAVLIENPAITIAAILGVMKAGKICVPLDHRYPQERTAYILGQCGFELLVTTTENRAIANDYVGEAHAVVDVEQLDSEISAENPNLPVAPHGLSYILYTSGSTGQPKGVAQIHRNRLHEVLIFTNSLYICFGDRMALFYSCSCGMGMMIILSALLNGAALFPYEPREQGLSKLARWLCQEEINIYFSIPSVFRHVAERLTGKEDLSRLRLVHVATEKVTKQDIELFQTLFPSRCTFVTGLASNETGKSRQLFLGKRTVFDESIVPVGYAVEGKEVLLLDEGGQEVGYNQVGEIVVRSKYISPGYWKRPDLTHAAFRPDSSGEGGQLFFTGDLGLMRSDGCLILKGRKDFQAKIRGYRVEFGEIEATLLNSGLVKEAVVVARENGRGSKDLVAYTVPGGERQPNSSELRLKIRESLPEYMIPTYFMTLDSLPYTPTGKLDRRALPDPDRTRPKLGTPFVAPRNPTEEKVSQLWTDVLGLDEVGIHDPFLELGGDSLRAIQIINLVLDRFQVTVPIEALLMEAPTIARSIRPVGLPSTP